MRYRPRRLRSSDNLRKMVRETSISVDDLIYPLFIKPGKGIKEEIASMQGQFRYSLDMLEAEIHEIAKLGIRSVLLFGLTDVKDEHATDSHNQEGVVQAAIKIIKCAIPDMVVMTDVCVCAYTPHGHCGVVEGDKVKNDKTLEILQKMALSHAKAGADIVAPSAMMDGQVEAIREILDENGFEEVGIMAYAAKYFSAYYGPFRDAADSAPQFGDRASYQMDVANSREALREIEEDINEGADIIMVKPAALYLDIINQASQITNLPIAAYNVSGEYAMIKAAAANGWLDEKRAMMEMMISMKRAGAKLIITYFAKDIAKILKEQ